MRLASAGAIALVTFGLTHIAFAADKAVPRAPVHVIASSWTGVYFGAAVGYGAFLEHERTFDPGGALFLEQNAATNGRVRSVPSS
jgi:hypothetical protein